MERIQTRRRRAAAAAVPRRGDSIRPGRVKPASPIGPSPGSSRSATRCTGCRSGSRHKHPFPVRMTLPRPELLVLHVGQGGGRPGRVPCDGRRVCRGLRAPHGPRSRCRTCSPRSATLPVEQQARLAQLQLRKTRTTRSRSRPRTPGRPTVWRSWHWGSGEAVGPPTKVTAGRGTRPAGRSAHRAPVRGDVRQRPAFDVSRRVSDSATCRRGPRRGRSMCFIYSSTRNPSRTPARRPAGSKRRPVRDRSVSRSR